MGVPTYSAVAFVADDTDFTIAAAAERFRSRPWASSVRTEVIGDREFHLLFDGWRLLVAFDDDESLADEGRETAEAFPDYAHAAEVAACKKMVSVYSKDPDPDGEHFNDYLLVVEELVDSFRGVYALDEASETWFDEDRA
jgi:hypothetical protein